MVRFSSKVTVGRTENTHLLKFSETSLHLVICNFLLLSICQYKKAVTIEQTPEWSWFTVYKLHVRATAQSVKFLLI